MFQPNGVVPLAAGLGNSGPLFSEGDFESTDKPIWAVAVNYEKNDFFRTTTGIDLRDDVWEFDGLFKFKGFSATGAYFMREREPEAAANGAPGVKFDSDGFYAQAGYLSARSGSGKSSGATARSIRRASPRDNDQTETRGGLNYYYNRHALKVQADYGRLKNKANGQKNDEFRIQTQFLF